MSLMLHVDHDRNDWLGYQRSTDAPNHFSAVSVSITNLLTQVNGAGSGAASGAAFERYSSDRAKYGKDRITWTTGTAASANINIGYNGVSFTMGTLPAGTYTVVLWAKLASGSSANTFSVVLTNAVSANYAVSTATALNSSTWTKLTATGTTPSTQNLCAQLLRQSGTSALSVEITGAMILSGSTAPTWFNCGAASIAEDLTDYWAGGGWGLGFVKAYQYVAPVGKAELTLLNSDKRFSPEYASGPLFGDLLPNLLVQIADPDYGIWWTGWTDSWAPEPGTNRDKKAKLSATDARRFMANKLPALPMLQGVNTIPEITAIILDYFVVPNTGGMTLGNDTPNPIRTTAWDATTLGVIFDYYADNVPYDYDAVKVLAEIYGALQGRVWFPRDGNYQLSQVAQGDDTPASYVDIGQNWTNIADAVTAPIINKCEVVAYKRKAQSSGPYTVWESDDVPFTIPGGGTETFRAFFKYDTTRKEVIGAITLSVIETNSGVAGDITAAITLPAGAQSAEIVFTNNNAAARDVTAASITATTRIIQNREISKEYEDSASINAHGTHGERLTFGITQKNAHAKQLARYRVTRFKDPHYEIPWVELDVDKRPQDAFDCEIGAAVHVEDDQTGHDDYYAVIGEYHTVKDGLTNHTVKLHLEPLYPISVADTSSA